MNILFDLGDYDKDTDDRHDEMVTQILKGCMS